MEAQELLSDATTLMLLGMGTVFVFLTVLVFVTALMSSLVNRLVPAKAVTPATVSTVQPRPDPNLPAVIAAAIHAHRSRH